MRERFQKVFYLPSNLYTVTSPVIIEAGVLLKDMENDNVLVQLKFNNISNGIIKALKVKISYYDSFGNIISDSITHQYLDINAGKDIAFGQNEAIVLPNKNARSFEISVKEVVFDNGKTWQGTSEKWSELPKPHSIEEVITEPHLLQQYITDIGKSGVFAPETINDLWYCTCGKINRIDEEKCFSCHRTYPDLEKAIKTQTLQEHYELAIEKKREEEEKRKIEEEKRKKEQAIAVAKFKKLLKKLVILTILVVIIVFVFRYITQTIKYNNAAEAHNNKEFEKAISLYQELNGFKDSEAMITDVKYDYAVFLSDNEYLDLAMSLFSELGSYKDSEKQLELLGAYNTAIYKMDSGKFEEAKAIFETIPDFKNSKELIKDLESQIIEQNYIKAAAAMHSSFEKAKKLFEKVPEGYKDKSKHLSTIEEYSTLIGTYRQIDKFNILSSSAKYNEYTMNVYKNGDSILADFVATDYGTYAIRGFWSSYKGFIVEKSEENTFTLTKNSYVWSIKDGVATLDADWNDEPTEFFKKYN